LNYKLTSWFEPERSSALRDPEGASPMSFIRIIHDGIPFVINLELIVSAGYKEANKQLDIKFSGGETMTLGGQDAERVWGLFSRESERDEVY
jgi:hypothetical protein